MSNAAVPTGWAYLAPFTVSNTSARSTTSLGVWGNNAVTTICNTIDDGLGDWGLKGNITLGPAPLSQTTQSLFVTTGPYTSNVATQTGTSNSSANTNVWMTVFQFTGPSNFVSGTSSTGLSIALSGNHSLTSQGCIIVGGFGALNSMTSNQYVITTNGSSSWSLTWSIPAAQVNALGLQAGQLVNVTAQTQTTGDTISNVSATATLNYNVYKTALCTVNNTLDDGTGNVVLKGLTQLGSTQYGSANASLNFPVPGYYLDQWGNYHFKTNVIGNYTISSDSAPATEIFGASSANIVVTKNNTLDDGTGNMVIKKNFTSGPGTLGPTSLINWSAVEITSTGGRFGFVEPGNPATYTMSTSGSSNTQNAVSMLQSAYGGETSFGSGWYTNWTGAPAESILTWNWARLIIRGVSMGTGTNAPCNTVLSVDNGNYGMAWQSMCTFTFIDNGSNRGYFTGVSPWWQIKTGDVPCLGLSVVSWSGGGQNGFQFGPVYLQFSS